MKRLVPLLLVIVMCLTLFACDKSTNSETQPTSSPSAGGSGAVSAPSGTPQGYLEDDVDHYARDKYEIVFLANDFQFLQQSWYAGLQAFEKRFNIHMTSVSADGDWDSFINNIELVGTRGYDGVIVLGIPEINVRVAELMNETGVPWLAFVNIMLDDNGRTIGPNVILDQYAVGWKTMRWLLDNYPTYWGNDIDGSKVGEIDITLSASIDLFSRQQGPKDLFLEHFPDGSFFPVDCVSTGLVGMAAISPEAAYDLVTATVSANPQIEYWFVTGATEFFGPGAARALEDLGRTPDNAMVCVVGHGANVVDWQSMSDDTVALNMACLMISDILYAAPAVAGIVALIDGRTTNDTLWVEKTPPNYQFGNDFGVWEVENRVVTRFNYQDYFDEVDALIFGED